MADPLQEIFAVPSPELFRGRELLVRHGALERFPTFMREGPMENIECEALPDYEPEEVEQLLGWLARGALIRPLPAQEWDES